MPRRSRVQFPGALFHVTARGNRRQDVFAAPADAWQFLETLDCAIRRFGWRCHGYCLMPNHYHLVVETPDANLSAGMHRLNGVYAQWFNRQYGFEGHLFQDRFHSLVVESNWHLLELSRYLVLNPVRAGLCDDPVAWRWSNYRAMAGLVSPPRWLTVDWLLRQFGERPESARAAFKRFVHDGRDLAWQANGPNRT